MVAPVPVASAEQDVPRELRGGNPELMAQQRRELNMYANKLVERLGQREGAMSIQEASAWMRQFVIGWWESMQESRLTGKNAFSRFIQLFPNKFELVGRGPRSRVRLA